MLFIFNIIITIYSFNLFQNLSFKSSDIKVYKNIYSINLAKNTELTDLYVLTERTCFNKCDLLLEKDITKLFKNYLFILRDDKKYDYDILEQEMDNNFVSSFSHSLYVHQHVCLDLNDCKREMNELYLETLNKYDEYLNNHVNELIYITNYIQTSKVYNLGPETQDEYRARLSTLASQIVANSGNNINDQEAIEIASNTIKTIDGFKKNEKNDEYFATLFDELNHFKKERLNKILSFYDLKFIEKRNWEGGLKESPFRNYYYKIPNLLKSFIIFFILFLSSIFLIRIYDILKNPKEY